MSLDVYLERVQQCTVFDYNITHNLGKMASEAGLYLPLWRPEEVPVTTAGDLVPLLRAGLERLEAEPDRFRAWDAPNGWGKYEHLVEFVRRYLAACEEFPDATVRTSR